MSYKDNDKMPEEDVEKIMDLMEYVRKNPDFTGSDICMTGRNITLKKYFEGRTNILRRAAGLPPATRYRPGWSGHLGRR